MKPRPTSTRAAGILAGLLFAGCRPSADGPPRTKQAAFADSIGVTQVRLDFDDRTVPEALAAIRERANLPVGLAEAEYRGDRRPDLPRLTLREPDPVPFWEAVERVMVPSGLTIRTVRGFTDPNEPQLAPLRGVRGPVSIDGAFRSEVLSIDHARGLALGGRDDGTVRESLRVQVQIRPEPRPGLRFLSAGIPEVLEAVDDRGRSLVASGGGCSFSTGGVGAMVADLALAMPDPPGGKLVRLRGTGPLMLLIPNSPPLDVSLVGAVGGTFEQPGVGLTVALVETTGIGRRVGTRIELILRTAAGLAAGSPLADEAIRFLDENGETAHVARSTVAEVPGGGTRLSFDLPGPAPTRLRYSGPMQAGVTVRFEFADLPLP